MILRHEVQAVMLLYAGGGEGIGDVLGEDGSSGTKRGAYDEADRVIEPELKRLKTREDGLRGLAEERERESKFGVDLRKIAS
jgi:hypothetical protein